MDRKGSLAVILFLFVFAEVSDASLIGNVRRMVGLGSEGKPDETQILPSPSPTSAGRSDQPDKSGINVNPSNSGTKASDRPKTENQVVNDANQEKKNEKCPLSSKRCTGENKMAACLQYHKNGSHELFILIQNEGETTLKVIATAVSSTISPKELEIPQHQAGKINVSVDGGKSPEIVLNAGNGNGDCVIHIVLPISEGKFLQWIPSYANQLTLVNGAYFMFLMVLIVGGTWACCKFGKRGRRTDGGISYQELEMGLPRSDSMKNVEAADGWDQVWDDDWDEEGAVKSPGGQRAGNVSGNGLTSRSPNREGWENGWDE